MKKYLYLILCVLSFCFISNAKALNITGSMVVPEFDAYVSNEAGASIFDSNNEAINIPYNTQIKLVADTYKEDTSIIEYNGNNYSIKNSDIKLVNDTFEKEDGFKLEEPQKFVIPADSKMYKGPSDIFFEELGVIIPKDTEIEYEYIDVNANNNTTSKFVYTTYAGESGWVFTSTNLDDYKEEVVITPGAIETPQEEKEVRKPSTLEMVLVIGLAIILLLSITSLIALILINKKNSDIIDNRILENPEDK